MSGIGGFGAAYKLPSSLKNPVLISGSDGVGTKLKLAFELSKHDTVGIDLVAMSVNDIITQGAKPLFFQDYFSCGKLNVQIATEVIGGIAEGCYKADCTLIGGETAEMPGFYKEGEYDLAGFAVGVVEHDAIINGKDIESGNVLVGMKSSGLHSNGFSMVRHILRKHNIKLHESLSETTLGDLLMEPTRIYVKSVVNLKSQIKILGLAHITGGGLVENIPRIIPDDLCVAIGRKSWKPPEIFEWIAEVGKLDEQSMMRIFNNGVGMVAIVNSRDLDETLRLLEQEGVSPFVMGEVEERRSNSMPVNFTS